MDFQPKKKDKLNVGVNMQQQAVSRKLLGSQKIQRGQRLYEYDTVNNVIKLAEFKQTTVEFPVKGVPGHLESARPGSIRMELKPNPNCIYRVAINLQNAKKKFAKYIEAKNKRGTGKTHWVDCPACEANKSVELILTNTQEGVQAHIFPCYCGYQGKTIDDFIKK